MSEHVSVTTFYIARHGETEFNLKGILQGHVDSPLTERGKEQARQLGEKLADIKFDLVFTSDLFRAQHTAEIALVDTQLTVNTTNLLRELTFGRFDNQPVEVYKQTLREAIEQFAQLSDDQKLSFRHEPSMETYEEANERLIRFIRETALAYSGKCILIVTHGALLQGFLIKLGFGTYDELSGGAFGNGAYIKLESDGIDFFIKETYKVNKKKFSE